MIRYPHTVQYYETDKMGITHHSNYIRWMEEARVEFLKQIGWSFDSLEAQGIVSPVVEVSCKYKAPTVFAETVTIDVFIKEFKGVKLVMGYRMWKPDGTLACEGESAHCFQDQSGRLLRLKKEFPAFDAALKSLVEPE